MMNVGHAEFETRELLFKKIMLKKIKLYIFSSMEEDFNPQLFTLKYFKYLRPTGRNKLCIAGTKEAE